MLKKSIIISLILTLFITILLIVSGIDKTANLPKYKEKIWPVFFKTFMAMPDVFKSSFMIFSGKRSFSNLFNDYNVKFLPKTQYIPINLERKKINFEGVKISDRNTFFLETYKDDLILATKSGDFYKIDFNELVSKRKKISYNKYIIKNLFDIDGRILDILVFEDKIFVSKVSNYKKCTKLEIYSADLNENLNFEIFKSFDECGVIGLGAGRIKNLDFNNAQGILITTQDSDNDNPGDKPQDDNSIFGKTVFVNLKTKNYEIFSKGHRNAQGLFIKNQIILSTEHGPKGGDEINRILYKKNYGWPISSYGEPYKRKSLKYIKGHKENGFEEPLYAFVPSIGISELIILPNTFNSAWMNNALVTSLNGRSIYRVKFEDENYEKVIYVEKIYIGERIRDIKYVNKLNFIIVALERTGDIGILKNK